MALFNYDPNITDKENMVKLLLSAGLPAFLESDIVKVDKPYVEAGLNKVTFTFKDRTAQKLGIQKTYSYTAMLPIDDTGTTQVPGSTVEVPVFSQVLPLNESGVEVTLKDNASFLQEHINQLWTTPIGQRLFRVSDKAPHVKYGIIPLTIEQIETNDVNNEWEQGGLFKTVSFPVYTCYNLSQRLPSDNAWCLFSPFQFEGDEVTTGITTKVGDVVQPVKQFGHPTDKGEILLDLFKKSMVDLEPNLYAKVVSKGNASSIQTGEETSIEVTHNSPTFQILLELKYAYSNDIDEQVTEGILNHRTEQCLFGDIHEHLFHKFHDDVPVLMGPEKPLVVTLDKTKMAFTTSASGDTWLMFNPLVFVQNLEIPGLTDSPWITSEASVVSNTPYIKVIKQTFTVAPIWQPFVKGDLTFDVLYTFNKSFDDFEPTPRRLNGFTAKDMGVLNMAGFSEQ